MKPCLAALVLALALAAPAMGQELTEQNYRSIRDQVALKPADLAYQRVPWKDTVFDGLVEAQRADKPLFLWLYFGDPRGLC